jgi:hypothetical protein
LKEIGFEMTLRGQRTTASDLYDSLLDSINVVFEDVVHGGEGQIDPVAHPVEYALYDNRFKVVDGPWCVCFVLFLFFLYRMTIVSVLMLGGFSYSYSAMHS